MYKFDEEKNQHSERNKFREWNQFYKEKNQRTNFTTRKNQTFNKILRTKLVHKGSMNKISFPSRKKFTSFTKKEHAKSFTTKNQQATSSTNKNQHATSWIDKISFTRIRTNVQVSGREKTTCKKFHGQKSWCNKFHDQKSARNECHEQNKFHAVKNQLGLTWIDTSRIGDEIFVTRSKVTELDTIFFYWKYVFAMMMGCKRFGHSVARWHEITRFITEGWLEKKNNGLMDYF